MTWGTVAVIGGGLLAGALGGSSGGGAQSGSNSPGYYDPYAQYRGAAAQQLNQLMLNPGSITNTPTYQAMLEAAQRQGASQGYNGSGNALVAAANAGGQAYQQQFNNLAMLSGAEQSPAQGAMLATQQGNYNNQMNQQMWGGVGSLIGSLGSSMFGGGGGGGYSIF